jgi:hypothetical protein
LQHEGINVQESHASIVEIQLLQIMNNVVDAQAIFYTGDFARQMDAVLSDEVDMGFLLTGWLEANYPQNIPLFQLLDLKTLNYQSEQYPFLTSTELMPAFGLPSAPYVPWSLQHRILNTLTLRNATHKAAQSAGIATFARILRVNPEGRPQRGRDCARRPGPRRNALPQPLPKGLRHQHVPRWLCQGIGGRRSRSGASGGACTARRGSRASAGPASPC